MGAALKVVYRCIARLLRRKAGSARSRGHGGAVTLIQRFGSAMNLNVHFHLLVPGGVWSRGPGGVRFHEVSAPTNQELQRLVIQISERLGRQLERQRVLVRDAQSSYLALPSEDADALADLQGHSISYRIALGPQRGRKAFQLQTLPLRSDDQADCLAQAAGFSLHAGVATAAGQRERLERICRYVSRSAVATERVSLTAQGKVRYALNTAYGDGTTHVIFEPLDFLARLAALVPKPRVNLTRFHGVLAPNHRLHPGVHRRGGGG